MKVKKFLVKLCTPIDTNSKIIPPEDCLNASEGIYDAQIIKEEVIFLNRTTMGKYKLLMELCVYGKTTPTKKKIEATVHSMLLMMQHIL